MSNQPYQDEEELRDTGEVLEARKREALETLRTAEGELKEHERKVREFYTHQ